MAGRISIVVAHRLSTVGHAAQVLVLDCVRLVERGTHDEFIGRRGLYFLLVG
jgi:ABC-type multidrug transport system fused ATPase/permease subunit